MSRNGGYYLIHMMMLVSIFFCHGIVAETPGNNDTFVPPGNALLPAPPPSAPNTSGTDDKSTNSLTNQPNSSADHQNAAPMPKTNPAPPKSPWIAPNPWQTPPNNPWATPSTTNQPNKSSVTESKNTNASTKTPTSKNQNATSADKNTAPNIYAPGGSAPVQPTNNNIYK